MAVVERSDGPEVDAADEPASGVVRLGRLVDVNSGENFGRILIEFDGAAVVGRRLLAAIERCGREVRTEATDGDDLRAAVVTLRGKARKSCDRFRDAVVRKLADV